MKIHNVGGEIFLEDEEGNFFIVTDDPEVAAAAEGNVYLNKRINELAKAGRIVETGRTVRSSSGRGEREWRVAT